MHSERDVMEMSTAEEVSRPPCLLSFVLGGKGPKKPLVLLGESKCLHCYLFHCCTHSSSAVSCGGGAAQGANLFKASQILSTYTTYNDKYYYYTYTNSKAPSYRNLLQFL